MAKLKVFKAPIGFHDAYVAVPSRKAALEAWGAQSNLFASGGAEQVTEPALMAPALAEPGTVIKVARGTMKEHLASLPKSPSPSQDRAAVGKRKDGQAGRSSVRERSAPIPRPSRTALDEAQAEADLHDAEVDAQITALETERQRLATQIDQIGRAGNQRRSSLSRRIEQERDKYEKAMDVWRNAD